LGIEAIKSYHGRYNLNKSKDKVAEQQPYLFLKFSVLNIPPQRIRK